MKRRQLKQTFHVDPMPTATPRSELSLSEGLRRSMPRLYADLGSDGRTDPSVAAGIIAITGLLILLIAGLSL